MQPTPESAAEMIATVRSITSRSRRFGGLREIRDRLNDGWDGLWEDEQRRARTIKRGGIALTIAAVLGGVGLYLLLRPYPQPDYSTAGIDEIFNFTLLRDEFNNLPIDKRLELLGMIRARIEQMGAGESALLAAFAAGIGGQARDQLEENISHLMVDLWDQHAVGYPSIPAEDRPTYLDGAFITMVRAMETVAGQTPRQTDAELLMDAKEQARRDQKAIADGRGLDARETARLFDILNNGVGTHASPVQRTRGQLMIRDMTRQLRGQDLKTGKPLR